MDEGTLANADNMPMEDESGILKWEIPIEEWKDPHECILLNTMLDLIGQYTKMIAKGSVQRAHF
jgi:hypothetical protein